MSMQTHKDEEMMASLWMMLSFLSLTVAMCYFFGAGISAIILSLFFLYKSIFSKW